MLHFLTGNGFKSIVSEMVSQVVEFIQNFILT